jgi:tetratricopeptide (TPR) repeat protein
VFSIKHDRQGLPGKSSSAQILHRLLLDLRDRPEDARTLFYLGKTDIDLGRYAEAMTAFERYLKVGPWKDERFHAQLNKAQCLFWQHLYGPAIIQAFRALQEDPEWSEAYVLIGECYYYLGMKERCIAWMELALKVPNNPSPMFNDFTNSIGKARAYLDRANTELGLVGPPPAFIGGGLPVPAIATPAGN